MIGKTVSYLRRQLFRRLTRAGTLGAAALLAALLGLFAPAVVLLLCAVGLAITSRHWLGLAARAGLGARSEAHVRRTLAALEREGWRIRHSLNWQGPGDIDSVAIAPAGLAFAIKTKCPRLHDGTSRTRHQHGPLAAHETTALVPQRRAPRPMLDRGPRA